MRIDVFIWLLKERISLDFYLLNILVNINSRVILFRKKFV